MLLLTTKRIIKKRTLTVMRLLIVLTFILVVGIWLLRINYEKWKLLEETYKHFEVYSILQTCQLYFGNAELDKSFPPKAKFYCKDDFGNKYTFIINGKDDLSIYKNGVPLEKSKVDEFYEKIFSRVIVETVRRYPPADYETSDPNSIFSYLNGWVDEFEYKDGKYFVKISGMDQFGNIIDIIYEVKKIHEKVKIYVKNVYLNGRQLSENESKILLAVIYRKKIDKEILETVRQCYLPQFPEAPLGEVLSKISNGRFYVANERNRIVEFSALDESGKGQDNMKRITIGFSVTDYGIVKIAYFKVNDLEKSVEEAYEYLREVYKRFGYVNNAQEIEKYKRRILISQIPNTAITYEKFVNNYLKDVSWNYKLQGSKVLVYLEAFTVKDNKKLEIAFELSSETSEGLVVVDVNYMNKKTTLTKLLTEILPKELLKTDNGNEESDESESIISVVQSKISLDGSKFKNNKAALENFLSSLKWTYKDGYVIASGKGIYGQKTRVFEIVFKATSQARPVIETLNIDGKPCDANVCEYIIGKIYGIDSSERLLERVRNTKISKTRLGNLFSSGKWKVSLESDLIKYSDDDFNMTLMIAPSGEVEITKIDYSGQDLTAKKDELIGMLEAEIPLQKVVAMLLEQREQIDADNGLSEGAKSQNATPTNLQDEPVIEEPDDTQSTQGTF